MKKLFTFILALVYISASAGVTVHLHYCMDKFIGWNMNGKHKDCGMEKKENCCKHEQHFVKYITDQKIEDPSIQLSQRDAVVIPGIFINLFALHSLRLENYQISHSPPNGAGIDILIHNCVFRI